MEESTIQKKSEEEMHGVYIKRRLLLFGVICLIILGFALALFTYTAPPLEEKPAGNASGQLSPPIFEKPPSEPEPVILNTTNETAEACLMAPLEYLGCLEENMNDTIFRAYGMRPGDKNVRDIMDVVEDRCRLGDDPDRQCIVDTVFTQSENSWACEWECLEDMASCPSYKTHLAVSVLRQYVPPTDVFVGRTKNFDFFMIYKDNDGNWMQPQYIPIKDNKAETLYNDVYHAGPFDKVLFPEIKQVEPGDDFCFYFNSDRSCECKVEVKTFSVGECPPLPADMKGICNKPLTEKVIVPGRNEICFQVDDDADDALYTYKFELTSGEDHWFAGNALITTRQYDCCVNASFEGFLEVND